MANNSRPNVNFTTKGGSTGSFAELINSIKNGFGSGSPKPGTENANTEAAAPTVEDMKGSLDQLKADYQNQLRKDYDYNAGKIGDARDAQLRDEYLSHRKNMADLPENLAAMGVTGGGAQSNLTKLRSDYENNRNNAWNQSRQQLADAGHQFMQSSAEGNRSYNQAWQQFLQDLYRDRKNAQYDYDIAKNT